MRTFVVVPRRKCYWVEVTNDDGVRKMIIGFGTEKAALRCLKDLQEREGHKAASAVSLSNLPHGPGRRSIMAAAGLPAQLARAKDRGNSPVIVLIEFRTSKNLPQPRSPFELHRIYPVVRNLLSCSIA